MMGALKIFDLLPGWLYAGALALLLLASAILGRAWLGARDQVTSLTQQNAEVLAAANACTDSVTALQHSAATRALAARSLVAAAAERATVHARQADQIMASPPSTPGNDCQSAQDQVDTWLARRLGQPP